MGLKTSQHPVGRDAAAAALAARQHGNITYGQLVRLGFDAGAVQHRLARGRLFREHRGVYSVGRPAGQPLERAAAAVLAAGPHASLNLDGALMLWGWGRHWPQRFEVVLSVGDRRPGTITAHRVRNLTAADLTRQHGIPCTSPARTLLDCLPRTAPTARRRLVQDALLSPYLTHPAIADVLARFPTHPGARELRALSGESETRSPLEDEFLAFCARHRLPTPQTNVFVAGHRVDALFPEQRVIVEIDSWRFHGDRASFETDRARDADTLAAGHVTVRVTHRRLHTTPDAEARRLMAILAARTTGPPPPDGG
jgi:very-short-patch-repair endonuclease